MKLCRDELTDNGRQIQDKTLDLPDNDIMLYGLAIAGKSSYPKRRTLDSRRLRDYAEYE